jgi:zinc transporter 1/2/3
MTAVLESPEAADFNPGNVDLDTANPRDIICYLNSSEIDYDGRIGLRVVALFVILVTSVLATLFPVMATRARRFPIPPYVYLFARYFGSGVIIATAFIHLLDPAYSAIGPASCVGMTGGWAEYSWPPALAMTAVMFTFLLNFGAEWYVDNKYMLNSGPHAVDVESTTSSIHGEQAAITRKTSRTLQLSDQSLHTADQDGSCRSHAGPSRPTEHLFREQITAFLILEFGIIFHSVIIGLNLGVAGEEFSTLFPVMVFHQAFEGLGIGARLSVIPFPPRLGWLPWALCLAYGLTTPVAIAAGLGMASHYDGGSFTASMVSGVLDSITAGVLMYTGLVELLARDFLFNPVRTSDKKQVLFMLACLFLGTILMALLGKWA